MCVEQGIGTNVWCERGLCLERDTVRQPRANTSLSVTNVVLSTVVSAFLRVFCRAPDRRVVLTCLSGFSSNEETRMIGLALFGFFSLVVRIESVDHL